LEQNTSGGIQARDAVCAQQLRRDLGRYRAFQSGLECAGNRLFVVGE